ncbi:MAG TPA: MFS transporter [Vicinamibacterales bacterium]|nr:MFS transporter [Vicinamibacterales bacterium]
MHPAVRTANGTISAEPATQAAFARLCAIGFLAYCSYAICRTPLLPLLARELGATPPMVGFVVGASTLTGIVLKLPAGAWSDVLGRRPLLVLGTIVFATMPFTYFGVASLGALVAIRFVHGAATAILGPVASASLSDLAPPARRATWLSTYSTVQGAGQALGPVVAGYLIAARRYDLAFVAAGLFAAGTPFMAARWPRTTRPSVRTRRANHLLRGIADVCRHPLILVTSLTQAAQFVLNGTLNAFLPLFAGDVIGLSASQLGWLFALQTVTTLATRPLMGMVSDRIGRRSVIVAGLSLCSGAVWLVSLAEGPAGLVTAVVAYAAGVAVTTAATSAFITDLSQRARYGAAHGVFGSIYDVGDALGPIAAGVLVATVGYAHMFRLMALVGFTMAVVFSSATRIRPGEVSGEA